MTLLAQVLGAKGAFVEIKESEIDGLGVFANVDIEEGVETGVHGFLVPAKLFNDYTLIIDEDTGLEPFPPYRYLNHSTDPNCFIDIRPDGECWLETIREIKAGEEMTINYGEDWE